MRAHISFVRAKQRTRQAPSALTRNYSRRAFVASSAYSRAADQMLIGLLTWSVGRA
ncbi:hypothetical protein TIFTF001_037513 [Ficus carica]|uniref:Uncharacterized protein n=1 Tax=Ficus carica TaxID=3494 RepID=A0AA88E757_FICCA|nr:hypothetical protein TIFTF001_037513 [Ficus carica]